ncbi:MAG: hypothetical protein KJ749_14345, partial [Planctomycetes bacterium]|nr:hypothetical protein [Planctomycetota bacterium]
MNQRNMNSLPVRGIFASLTVCFLVSGVASADPWCTDNGGASPWVCVNKNGGPPVPPFDFVLGFTEPASPDVTFKTGNNGWKVWSQVSETDPTPADLGDIKIDPSATASIYEVWISNGTEPGAANVRSICLDTDDPSWTGYTTIINADIAGDLRGDLILVKNTGGSGGQAKLLVVRGDILAPAIVRIPKIAKFSARGIGSGVNFQVDEIMHGGTFVSQSVTGGVHIDKASPGSEIFLIRVQDPGYVHIGTMEDSQLTVFLDVEGTITVDTVHGGSVIVQGLVDAKMVFGELGEYPEGGLHSWPYFTFNNPVAETLRFGNGIPGDAQVSVEYLSETGRIELENGDVDGLLKLLQGGEGTIVDGGEVNGTVRLAESTYSFGGAADFASVGATGEVVLPTGTTLAGNINISGDLLGSVFVGGCVEAASGSVVVGGNVTGSISIGGEVEGSVLVDGDVSVGGAINVGTDLSGVVGVGGDILGSVDVTGNFTGNICAANMYAGDMPGGVDLNYASGAEVCGWLIRCTWDGECNDGSDCTIDSCDQGFCWHTHDTGECPFLCPASVARPPDLAPKNRYLAFNPTNTAEYYPIGFKVELTASEYFPYSVGPLGWVGEPDENGISRIEDTEYLSNQWPDVVRVADCAIVPVATYTILAARFEEFPPALVFSDPFVITTIAKPGANYWADVAGPKTEPY